MVDLAAIDADVEIQFLKIVLSALIAAVTSLAGAVVFLFKQQSKISSENLKTKVEEIARLKEREEKLEKEIKELTARVYQLEIEKRELETRFMAFSTAHDSSPIPSWIKDTAGRVISCNQAYESAFLKPIGKLMSDYIGQDDFSIWPEEIAEAYRKNDENVRVNRMVWEGSEVVKGQNGETFKTRIIKYPRQLPGFSEPFGIAGFAPDIIVKQL